MSHVRTQIRNAAVAALADVGTVYASRMLPLEEPELPVILVYTNTESIEAQDFAALSRTIELIVECVAQGTDLEAELDPLLVGVEQALNAVTLDGLAVTLLPVSIEMTMRNDAAQPVGRAIVTYQATYRTAYADPETSL